MFCVSFVTFLFLGFHKDYLDSPYWAKATDQFAHSETIDKTQPAFGYPGSTLIVPASVLIIYGMSPINALRLIIVFELSIITTLITILTYKLRPQQLWWLASAGLFITSPLYYTATPPSVILGPLIVLILLLTLYIYEYRDTASTKKYVALGIVSGLALATRFDVPILVFSSIFLFIFFAMRNTKKSLIFGISAFITSLVCIPFLWYEPFTYLLQVYAKTAFHIHYPVSSTLRTLAIVPSIVTATLSFSLGFWLLNKKASAFIIPTNPLLWFMAVSGFIVGILFLTPHHPVWFFFPLVLAWEITLPLFVFHLLEKSDTPLRLKKILGDKNRIAVDFVAVFIVSHALMLFF